jgi:hypothetical protein
MGLLLNKAFGGDEKKPPKRQDGRPENEPKSVDEAEAKLKKVLGG